jgi:methyltransferase (TIGR00027 family)
LAQDPFGARLADGLVGGFTRFALGRPAAGRWLAGRGGPLTAFLIWMQLRTRALDDMLRDFVASGGRQLVLLGAGYDCRAWRFRELLGDAQVFEVDHPATQARKRRFAEGVPTPPTRYLAWDFEQRGTRELPGALAAQGLDPRAPSLTLWEGVTMYLAAESIDETVRAVSEYGGAGSRLAMTYIDRRAIQAPRGDAKLTAALVSRVGEPYRFGFEPAALPGWLAERGFRLLSDENDAALATRYLGADARAFFRRGQRRIALAARS